VTIPYTPLSPPLFCEAYSDGDVLKKQMNDDEKEEEELFLLL